MALEHEYLCTLIGGVLNLYLSITAMQRAANPINIFQLQAQRIPSATKNTKMKRESVTKTPWLEGCSIQISAYSPEATRTIYSCGEISLKPGTSLVETP